MNAHLSALICGIVDDYFAARIPIRANQKLVRGIARVTSSLAEERLADYLIDKFTSISKIYIDQGINLEGQKLHKPDLVVCVGNEIRVLVDVKMDLGHMRTHFHKIAEEAHNFISAARIKQSCTASVRTYKEDQQKEKINLEISKDIHQIFFIVSGGNIPQAQFESETSKAMKFENISITTLFPGDHANDQKRSQDKTIEKLHTSVDQKAVKEFDEMIEKLCGSNG